MKDKILINAQSSICIKSEKTVYFDPYMIEKETHDADVIFITHAHSDHFSPVDFQKAAKEDTMFVLPASMEEDALGSGIQKENMKLMRPEENGKVCDIEIEAVASYNIGKPMHPKKNGWLGYVITLEDTRIYVCGDMDATPEAEAVKCDIALVPIGGIFTMDAKKAAAFINVLKPKIVIPTHYGTIVGKPKDGQKFKQLVDQDITVAFKLFSD